MQITLKGSKDNIVWIKVSVEYKQPLKAGTDPVGGNYTVSHCG